MRYYALGADGSPVAQGEIALNGGTENAPNLDNDGIYDDVWHFTESVLPTDWDVDDPDDFTSPFGYYWVEDYNDATCLRIMTAGKTEDRVRVRTTSDYGARRYQWRVYVPSINDERAAIRAFLYSPDNNEEIGFEIGYDPIEGLMCEMYVEGGPTVAVGFDPGTWYMLRIVLTSNKEGNYVVSWRLNNEEDGVGFLSPRSDYICGYGPSDASFYIGCSVENSEGDPPQEDIEAYFDYVFGSLYEVLEE